MKTTYAMRLVIKTETKELPDRLRTKLDGLAALFDLDRGDLLQESFSSKKGEYIIDYSCVEPGTKRKVKKIIKSGIPEVTEMIIEPMIPV